LCLARMAYLILLIAAHGKHDLGTDGLIYSGHGSWALILPIQDRLLAVTQ
jgi:hypothetical protein